MIVFRSAVLVITGPIAVRKHAAALFRRENSYFTRLFNGTPFSIYIFTRKKLGTRALVTSLARLPVNYRQLSRTSLAV